MRKAIFAAFVAIICSLNANAQDDTSFNATGILDNWSITLQGGAKAPLNGRLSVFPNSRGVVGLAINKQLTPNYGLTLEGNLALNTSSWAKDQEITTYKSKTVFDDLTLMLLNRINLINVFGGWTGEKSVVELEAVAGGGWLRYLYNREEGIDFNTVAAKFGLNLNFNLGADKEFGISLKPAVIFDVWRNKYINAKLTKSKMVGEVLIGLTYNFLNSNGRHYQTAVAVMTAEELVALNKKIRKANNDKIKAEKANKELRAENDRLLAFLDECQNAPKPEAKPKVVEKVVEKVVDHSKRTLESTVTFRVGARSIEPSQQPNVERIATYLKNHPNATVDIKGYASPDGSVELNMQIAEARAKAVKDMLVNKYGISATRITAEGQGIGNMFEENDWNRVSICTINE